MHEISSLKHWPLKAEFIQIFKTEKEISHALSEQLKLTRSVHISGFFTVECKRSHDNIQTEKGCLSINHYKNC
jgi:hypothetical protein